MTPHPGGILARLGRRYGKDLALVQAAGGNASFKPTSDRLFIKSSGVRLKEMTSRSGWAYANYQEIREGLRRIEKIRSALSREACYAKLLGRLSRPKGRRISMEAGFHAVINKTLVLHLHSLAGILLGMLPESTARRLIGNVFGQTMNVRFVPPTLPGYELTRRMMQQYQSEPKSSFVELWIQRNHGVVWAGNQPRRLWMSIDLFERALRSYFSMRRYLFPHRRGAQRCLQATAKNFANGISGAHENAQFSDSGSQIVQEVCFCRWPDCRWNLEPLFPDFVIYFNLWSGKSPDLVKTGARTAIIRAVTEAQWQDKCEILYAHVLLGTLAAKCGSSSKLPQPLILQLKKMETERLRLKQIARA